MSKITDFFRKAGHTVSFYPAVSKLIGMGEAILLQQLLYWDGKGADKNGWIYKSSEELEQETGLSWEAQKRARNELKKMGLLEERHARLEHRIYFRIKTDEIETVFNKIADSEQITQSDNTGLANQGKPDSAIRESLIPRARCNIRHKTTTETTIIHKKAYNIESSTKDNESPWVEFIEEPLPEPPTYKPPKSDPTQAKQDAPKIVIQPSTPRPPVSSDTPKWADVRDYCKAMTYDYVDPFIFVEYYTKTGWTDKGGRAVKDWKGKCRTWNEHAIKDKKDPCWFDGAWPVPPPGNIDRDPQDLYRWNLFKRDFDLAKKKKQELEAYERRMGLK